jgi:hypothetical protein
MKLHVADRFYFGLPQIEQCTQEKDHFLIRLHKKRTPFFVDPAQEARTGTDRHGRKYTEDFGWLGTKSNPQQKAVRRIHLHRPGVKDELILITDLTDANKYPADDLLELYLQRWTIEKVFQQVTEVFCLDSLIGSSAKSTVFQAAFCFLLYNMIQVIRAYLAEAQEDVTVSVVCRHPASADRMDGNAVDGPDLAASLATIDGRTGPPSPEAIAPQRMVGPLAEVSVEHSQECPSKEKQIDRTQLSVPHHTRTQAKNEKQKIKAKQNIVTAVG